MGTPTIGGKIMLHQQPLPSSLLLQSTHPQSLSPSPSPCCPCPLFITHHPHRRRHCPCSPRPSPLHHLPSSLPSPSLSPSPLPATFDAIAIALATIAIALFVARHPHRGGHHPLCRRCRCSPVTIVAVAIALFASATIHGDCHCAVAAVLPSIAPAALTAIGIVPPLSLSPIMTPAVDHCHHRCPSPPPLPIAIALPSRPPLCIPHCRPLQLCCYRPHRPSTCQLVVMLDLLSLRHLHANRVVVSHLFPAVDIGVAASSIAADIFLGTVVP
jgi:hypothetical protein